MDNAKKHCEKLQKYIDKNLGKGIEDIPRYLKLVELSAKR